MSEPSIPAVTEAATNLRQPSRQAMLVAPGQLELRDTVAPHPGPGEVLLKGSFRYQACDDRKCYVPEDAPLEWRFKYEGLDRQRAPAEFQRKPN